jgi:hypothetical protein
MLSGATIGVRFVWSVVAKDFEYIGKFAWSIIITYQESRARQ